MESSSSPSFFARHEFLIRRLHSLSGLVPVGAFMVVHLLTNASVLDGARAFQTRVDMIHSLGKALPLVEWTFIFLPLIFHAVVGVMIARGAIPNTSQYRYAKNYRYTLQRITAWIALFFILGHVFHLHGWFKPLATEVGGGQFQVLFATSSTAQALQASVLIQLAYVIGILACVYHLANGLWTMGITWGLWTTPAAQHRANYLALAVGLALTAVGLGALYGMITVNLEDSLAIENKLNEHRVATGEVSAAEVDEERKALEQEEADDGTETADASR
ncbi:MAG: succinate dehydrogenase cytochrome b558 subunit [Pirellulales bacterium]|nr:succinate dehydrogenase cytochrome b558 subunit [Pirellulales bacterium]